MTTDVNAEYLTDSVNFRKYLGVYDEGDEHISVMCKCDEITVVETNSEFIKPRILETNIYHLSELQKAHRYD